MLWFCTPSNINQILLKISVRVSSRSFTALSKLKCPALLNKAGQEQFHHGALLKQFCPTVVAAQPGTIQGVQEHLMHLRPHVTAEAQISAPYPHHSHHRYSSQKDVNSKETLLQHCKISPNSAAVCHTLLRLVCPRLFRSRAGNTAEPGTQQSHSSA